MKTDPGHARQAERVRCCLQLRNHERPAGTSGEAMITNHWSGYSRLGRLTGAPIVYAYPKEGVSRLV